jgi:membrane protein implicated in regulation of membrane protease activity
MTRTRIVFFGILAVFLVIIAISLSMQIISETLLRQIFIGSAIFGVGVVFLDFLGIFGAEQGSGNGVDGGIDGDAGVDGGEIVFETGEGSSDFGDASGEFNGDADADVNGAESSFNTVLSVLTYLRLLVYFCLGFGPVGLVALLTGRSGLVALLLAVPVGVVAVFLAQAFFRFQQSDTDSSVRSNELLMREATVTVPLTHATMGRIRLQIGMSVVEQFALAEEPHAEFRRGDPVRIVRVTQECVYVR